MVKQCSPKTSLRVRVPSPLFLLILKINKIENELTLYKIIINLKFFHENIS